MTSHEKSHGVSALLVPSDTLSYHYVETFRPWARFCARAEPHVLHGHRREKRSQIALRYFTAANFVSAAFHSSGVSRWEASTIR